MKGHFKSLSQINTAPVPTVLSTDIPTQMESTFINEKCMFWIKNTIMYCPYKPGKPDSVSFGELPVLNDIRLLTSTQCHHPQIESALALHCHESLQSSMASQFII
jgi:hypothetical protein